MKFFAFQSIKEIVSGNFIVDLLIGMTNLFTIYFNENFCINNYANC